MFTFTRIRHDRCFRSFSRGTFVCMRFVNNIRFRKIGLNCDGRRNGGVSSYRSKAALSKHTLKWKLCWAERNLQFSPGFSEQGLKWGRLAVHWFWRCQKTGKHHTGMSAVSENFYLSRSRSLKSRDRFKEQFCTRQMSIPLWTYDNECRHLVSRSQTAVMLQLSGPEWTNPNLI